MDKYIPRLKTKYHNEIVPKLKEEFNFQSVMQVPILQKIVINRGVGEAVADKKLIETSIEEVSAIAGQKAIARSEEHTSELQSH